MTNVRVIIVDDDVSVRRSLARVVQDAGATPLVAGSVQEALAIEATSDDGWIVDLKLPDGLGIDLLRTLKARNLLGAALMLTGHASVALSAEAACLGVALHPKPCGTAPIVALVDAVRRGRGWSQQAFVEALARELRLTPKERSIVASRLAGTARGGLGHAEGVSNSTMKGHVTHILAKAERRGYANESLSEMLIHAVQRKLH